MISHEIGETGVLMLIKKYCFDSPSEEIFSLKDGLSDQENRGSLEYAKIARAGRSCCPVNALNDAGMILDNRYGGQLKLKFRRL